jgi:glycosyltransferase involved in cell wall biosynthesis
MKNFKRLVVLSKELKKHYTEQYNIPDKLIVVAYNGANDNLLSKNLPVVNLAKNPHNLNVGYIGHIYPGKGMEVITNIAKYCKWANFHIVGGRENDIQKWKSITEHDDNIYFYGHYKPSQIKGFQNFIEVLLLPPMQKVMVFGDKFIEQKYAPPIKLFDYMSWGKAIIASNYLSEILADGQTAILCDPLYFEEWISALTLLRTDIQMREMLGHNARSDYIKKFLWSNRAEKVLANLTF